MTTEEKKESNSNKDAWKDRIKAGLFMAGLYTFGVVTSLITMKVCMPDILNNLSVAIEYIPSNSGKEVASISDSTITK